MQDVMRRRAQTQPMTVRSVSDSAAELLSLQSVPAVRDSRACGMLARSLQVTSQESCPVCQRSAQGHSSQPVHDQAADLFPTELPRPPLRPCKSK